MLQVSSRLLSFFKENNKSDRMLQNVLSHMQKGSSESACLADLHFGNYNPSS
ncbi:hypothetical protein C1H46_045903 [Malus baccata]|uniref:Uncharacterized protein n=1 Tax=Malus baccata TaxID=106549 RepID=A0A540K2Q1_MALBA|nr:hypothetical protein C1H46_045903 [Malus baccata]